MTTPTTCEPTEEQRKRARALCTKKELLHTFIEECDDCRWIAQALAQESSRANERAEGLQAQVAALEAGATQRTLLKEADDAAYVQLRTRSVEAEARAEGLAKELEALRAIGPADIPAAYWPYFNRLVMAWADAKSGVEFKLRTAEKELETTQEKLSMAVVIGQNARRASEGSRLLAADKQEELSTALARVAELEKQLADKERLLALAARNHDCHVANANDLLEQLAKLREQVGAVGDRELLLKALLSGAAQQNLGGKWLVVYTGDASPPPRFRIAKDTSIEVTDELRAALNDALTKAVQHE